MNHYNASQRKVDGRYDYTIRNDGLVSPIGYCAGKPSLTKEDYIRSFGEAGGRMFDSLMMEYENHKTQYHSDGHSTDIEACNCYRRYELDHVKYRIDLSEWHGCDYPGCSSSTKLAVSMGPGHMVMYTLCEAHHKRECLEELYLPGSLKVSFSS